ncbi:MAG: hypothetical protein QME60_06910 [Verrucomicrobiota bacterium]|nr:hypothetical protein [Verrucomicrobiota bacterium]
MDGFIFPVPFAGLLAVIAAMALWYLWLGCRCEALGKELKRLEDEKAELTKRCLNEEYKWARMKSPESIDRALARHGIVMIWPRSEQIVRLTKADLEFWGPEGIAKHSRAPRRSAELAMHD